MSLEKPALQGSLPPSNLVIGQVSPPDRRIRYMADINPSYSDYEYEKGLPNWDAENEI